jgi:hypothetical protein
MARKVGSKGNGLIYALHMIVVVVNSLWDEEIFEG